jgi:hypothetical protein
VCLRATRPAVARRARRRVRVARRCAPLQAPRTHGKLLRGGSASRLASHPVVCPAGAARCRALDQRADCFKPGRESPGARVRLSSARRCAAPGARHVNTLLPRFRSAVRDPLAFVRCESETNSEIGYDPSAGSPTETLLRLLLPLKDQVRTSFSLAVSRTDRPSCPDRPVPGEPVRSSH